jgi:hypothetical protein
MKSRISIWNRTNNGNGQNLGENLPQQKNTNRQNPNRQIISPEPTYQDTFEYAPIEGSNIHSEPSLDVSPDPDDYPPMKRDESLLKSRQKRRHSLSVACSEEEAELLRQAAREKGMTFSNWARRTLFRSAGMAMPKRPK